MQLWILKFVAIYSAVNDYRTHFPRYLFNISKKTLIVL